MKIRFDKAALNDRIAANKFAHQNPTRPSISCFKFVFFCPAHCGPGTPHVFSLIFPTTGSFKGLYAKKEIS